MYSIDLQLNQSQCITYVSRLWEYHYYNVCSGKVTVIPWGIYEYSMAALALLFGLAMSAIIVFILGLDIKIMRRMVRGRK